MSKSQQTQELLSTVRDVPVFLCNLNSPKKWSKTLQYLLSEHLTVYINSELLQPICDAPPPHAKVLLAELKIGFSEKVKAYTNLVRVHGPPPHTTTIFAAGTDWKWWKPFCPYGFYLWPLIWVYDWSGGLLGIHLGTGFQPPPHAILLCVHVNIF